MAWFDSDWLYRVKVTIDSGEVDADLTDFPVYVDLSDLPAGFFTHVKSDGSDIRVTKTDETTEVAREVVTITTGSSIGELHFKATGTLSSSSDTDYYIYYGNSSASEPAEDATYGRENVWNSDYQGVWHLQEDPSGSAPQMLESTSNDRDGTSSGSMTTGDSVAVQIEKGLDFDGSNDYVSASSFGNSSSSNLTISCWFRPDSVTADQFLVDESNITSYGGGLSFRITSGGKLRFWQQDATDALVESSTSISTSVITYGVGTYDGSNSRVYLGGYLDNTAATTALSPRNAANPQIGHSSLLGGYFDGDMDEVRILSVANTATWISTEYNNQNSPSTFYTTGAEETNGVAEQPAIFFGMNF